MGLFMLNQIDSGERLVRVRQIQRELARGRKCRCALLAKMKSRAVGGRGEKSLPVTPDLSYDYTEGEGGGRRRKKKDEDNRWDEQKQTNRPHKTARAVEVGEAIALREHLRHAQRKILPRWPQVNTS